MSTDTEHVDEGAETSTLETWRNWYHLPVLGVVMLFMLWLRTQSYNRFVTDDGTPALAGIDSWYHWRSIQWTSKNYPHTMPYEVWTGFPTGHYVGQFGTLFDQLIVTAAMIVGLGDPSTQTLYTVALLSIPVMAALVAIPVFYMGRRLGGTLGGIASIVILALAKGQFLSRSTVGQLDHHVGEVLFMAIAVLAMMVALTVGEREKPVYELVEDRDWTALRTPALYSAVAGLALALYIWVWPAGIVLIGIFGVFFAIHLCLDYTRGVSPDHVAFVGAVSLGITAIATTLLIEQPGFGTTEFSYLQPLLAILVAVGCLFMAWLARQWNGRGLDRRYYPVAIAGILTAVLLVMWLALPNLYSTLVGNLTGRLLPLGASDSALTVQEVQPPDDFFNHVLTEFGTAFYTMLAGLAFLAIRPFFGRRFRAEHTLVIVWSLFLISMAATQVRFSYYLLLAVAVVNAAFIAEVVQLFDLELAGTRESLRQIETYQIVVIALVFLLLFAPLLPPLAQATAWNNAEQTGPHSSATMWEGSNEWMQENTPAPGNYGNASNADQLDYYGTYTPENNDYEYPEGAYGVMSWWDYGHLITTQAERIPHSNPFQQNARSSSAFLTAESEERGELVLDAIAAGEPVADQSNEELRQAAAQSDSEEPIRYVMADYQMAGSKFGAITQFTGPGYSHYVTPEDYNGQPINATELGQVYGDLPYDDTMLSQLYFDDTSGMEHYRLVHEDASGGTAVFASYAQVDDNGQVIHVNENGEQVSPGQGRPAVVVNQQIPRSQLSQLQNHPNYQLFDAKSAAAVKTFERVDGATITGSADGVSDTENATVSAQVELETNSDRTFNYTQRTDVADDGTFELSVPYATNDELGVEDGYTDSSVEATGNYTVTAMTSGEQGLQQFTGETAVPEPAVVQGETVSVGDLEEVENPSGNETAGNETAGNETAGNETDDGSADAGDTNSSDDGTADTETANSLEPVATARAQ